MYRSLYLSMYLSIILLVCVPVYLSERQDRQEQRKRGRGSIHARTSIVSFLQRRHACSEPAIAFVPFDRCLLRCMPVGPLASIKTLTPDHADLFKYFEESFAAERLPDPHAVGHACTKERTANEILLIVYTIDAYTLHDVMVRTSCFHNPVFTILESFTVCEHRCNVCACVL